MSQLSCITRTFFEKDKTHTETDTHQFRDGNVGFELWARGSVLSIIGGRTFFRCCLR